MFAHMEGVGRTPDQEPQTKKHHSTLIMPPMSIGKSREKEGDLGSKKT
jgi:hypothetical protein